MNRQSATTIAKRYAKSKGYDRVFFADEIDGKYFFIYTKSDAPKYSGIPSAISIDAQKNVTEILNSHERLSLQNKAALYLRSNPSK